MSFWSAIVTIVAIIAFAAMRIAKYRGGHVDFRDRILGRSHIRDGAPSQPSPREAELEREVAEMRDRIAVLERIATDANSIDQRHSTSISAEIEALRDK